MVLPVSSWTLGFFESGLERDYGMAKAEAVRRMYRIISGFGLVVFLVFLAPIGTAPYGTEENFAVHRGLGLAIVGPLLVALVSLGYARAEWFRRGWEPLVALACMATPVTWALALLAGRCRTRRSRVLAACSRARARARARARSPGGAHCGIVRRSRASLTRRADVG